MFMRIAVAILTGLLLLPIGAKAEENHINRPRLTWSAFECSTYASLAGKDIESQRLFELGVQTGRSFLEAVQNGTLPASEREGAPVGVLFVLQFQGPSNDFVLGRIFDAVQDYAFDRVTKRDGLEIDPAKWVTDEKLKAMIAGTKYTHGNCESVK
jgi:hypothetical protein